MTANPERPVAFEAGLAVPFIGGHEQAPDRGYDLLNQLAPSLQPPEEVAFYPNGHYEQYLLMHKVLVGQQGAETLEGIYESLAREQMPRYLSAAGWAATEAALVQADKPVGRRLTLLQGAVDCWTRALDNQKQMNASGLDCLVEYAYPHRIALDIAVMPLLENLIKGTISSEVRRSVYQDCLNIAQSNAVRMNLMVKNQNVEGLSDHSGFGYECNALLAFNLRCSRGWFVIPSMARSDSGYHHRQQTHDLQVVHHRQGRILNMTPVEIKASASARDRERYKALLVRGKMHLSVPGEYTPERTLAAIEAVFEHQATKHEVETVASVSDRFIEMVRDYCAGDALGEIATSRSVTRFRDNSQVVAKHPGLLRVAV